VLDEGALQRVELAVGGKPFDGGDPDAVRGHGQLQAAVDRLAVDEYRAGPALAMVATFLGAGQLQLFAQQVEQRYVWRDRQGNRGAVDLEGNGAWFGAAGRNDTSIHPCFLRVACGRVDTSKMLPDERRTIDRQPACSLPPRSSRDSVEDGLHRAETVVCPRFWSLRSQAAAQRDESSGFAKLSD
jgi:hypothetical protein